VNKGVNIPPRGQSSPLGANHVVKKWSVICTWSNDLFTFPRTSAICITFIIYQYTNICNHQDTYVCIP
jgi:uncharacterized membrane protein